MKTVTKKVVSSLAVLALAAACGKESDSSGKNSSTEGRVAQEVAQADGSNIDGHYQAKFITLNPHVNGTIPGSANFFRKEDRLFVYLRLFAGGVRAWHQQFVYTGSRCPTMKDDKNGDGFIDINEAEAVMGKILIPLDSDVNTQSSGRRFFPLADLSGYYHYERIANFRRFLSDLQEEDKDPNDDTAKLGPDKGLVIAGKPVLILGVSETVELPDTVGTKGRHAAFQTLPIACGVFKKLSGELPGTPYVQDEIPGPVAEYQEGQDVPAPDDTGTTPGGSTTGGSTGSNESDDGDGPVSDGEGRTTSGTSGGTSDGGSTGRTSGGSTTGSSTTGSTTTGGGTTGSTTGDTDSSESSSSSSSSSSTTTTTTTGGSSTSSSSSSTSTGSTTGGFLDSSSGV